MRRLPLFIACDVSESMVGNNLRQMQLGLERLVKKLRTDPHALETVYLSINVFAGKAKTLTPLTELAMFYPPRLPVGAGTSLGVLLDHLREEIKKNVVKTTPDRKGDWRPVVYLMTDGAPTDSFDAAIERWKSEIGDAVTVVAIGIGKYASLEVLKRITDHVFLLEADTEQKFTSFIEWLSASIVTQSRSVSATNSTVNLAKLDPDIMSLVTDITKSNQVDENYVLINGRCSKSRLPYIIKYERALPNFENTNIQMASGKYYLEGVYPLEEDYFELSDTRCLTRTIDTNDLMGAPGCPHCGNSYGFALCQCGTIMCTPGQADVFCPTCKKLCSFGQPSDQGFEVTRGRG